MKKKSYSILLNIITVCFCICTIAVGVYAAKSASITASGTVGFTVHDCNVLISPYVTGYNGTESNATRLVDFALSQIELGSTSTNHTQQHSITNVCFNDLLSNGNTIQLKFAIKNKSVYYISGVLPICNIYSNSQLTTLRNNVSVSMTGGNLGENFTIAPQQTRTITLTLQVNDIDNFSGTSYFSFNINFQKINTINLASANASVLDCTSLGNTLGNRMSIKMGNNGTRDIDWVVIAEDTGNGFVKSSGLANNQIKAGTYILMSIPVLKTDIDFGTTTKYADSNIRSYINNNLYGDFSIENTGKNIYNAITPRTVLNETYVDGISTTLTGINDKFWVIGVAEAKKYLGDGNSIVGNMAKTFKFINGSVNYSWSSSTWSHYWTRTAMSDSNLYYFSVNGSLSNISKNYIAFDFGVRGFCEITII